MAKDKKSVIFYVDWIDIFDDLEDDEAGRLIKHFTRYINDKNPDPPDRLTSLLFKQIKTTLKRDLKKWEDKSQKNRENAIKRWHNNNANACDGKKRNAKHADSVSDIGLAILFSFFYMVTLVISALLLTIRYAFVAIGVVLFPIAIFFYYFPPMRQYGSLILNFLGTVV